MEVYMKSRKRADEQIVVGMISGSLLLPAPFDWAQVQLLPGNFYCRGLRALLRCA
jgi:hypothetical protein